MSYLNYMDDEDFSEVDEYPEKYRDRKQSAGSKRLKARRKIEDMRERRRLKRELDFFGAES